jgi:flagellar biosynthetic protein FliR
MIALAIAYGLAVCRLAGFIAVSPFPGQMLGWSGRMGLLAGLSLFAALGVNAPQCPTTLSVAVFPLALGEFLVGLVIGFAFYLCLSAADMLGHAISLGSGLSMPSVLNPNTASAESPLSRVLTLGALAIALGAGVHRVALGMLLASFRAVPMGARLSPEGVMQTVVDLAGASLSVGLRLATPVLGVTLVVQLSLAMIARAAPALQIFSVGLSVLVLSGLVVLGRALTDIGHALAEHLGAVGPWVERALTALAG